MYEAARVKWRTQWKSGKAGGPRKMGCLPRQAASRAGSAKEATGPVTSKAARRELPQSLKAHAVCPEARHGATGLNLCSAVFS